MDFTDWLLAVLRLFSDTLDALFGVDVFRFFLAWLVFASVTSFLALVVRSGRKGRL